MEKMGNMLILAFFVFVIGLFSYHLGSFHARATIYETQRAVELEQTVSDMVDRQMSFITAVAK